MKWPNYLVLIRHDVSAYNEIKRLKEQDPVYQEFKAAIKNDPTNPENIEKAREIGKTLSLKNGDHDTPLANGGVQAKKVGEELRKNMELPDVIFVSPYIRTRHTYKQILEGWPELKDVKVIEEERIREQEHGLSLLYNDREVFFTLFPDQRLLFELEGKYWYRHPQGENVSDVRSRNRAWITTLVREYSGKKVMAITHHLTILSTRANLERITAEEFIRLDTHEKPINCGVTFYKGKPELGSDGKLILDYYNKKFY